MQDASSRDWNLADFMSVRYTGFGKSNKTGILDLTSQDCFVYNICTLPIYVEYPIQTQEKKNKITQLPTYGVTIS